jgi:hypothetical protein
METSFESLQLLQFAETHPRPVKGKAKRQKVAQSLLKVVNWVS